MYDDFFDIGPNRKEMAVCIIVVLIFMVVIFGLGYMFGCCSSAGTENVHDNGTGTAGVGQQIDQAGADIQHAADGINKAKDTADKLGAGIKDAKDTAGYIQSTAADSAGIIAECQSIIGQVRARGAQDAPKN